jgi:hypothetical protein
MLSEDDDLGERNQARLYFLLASHTVYLWKLYIKEHYIKYAQDGQRLQSVISKLTHQSSRPVTAALEDLSPIEAKSEPDSPFEYLSCAAALDPI